MPRQLPWKVNGAATATVKRGSLRPSATASPSASRSPAPSSRPTPTPKAESTPEPNKKARRSLGLTPGRSPSTSPPPEPLEEEFMIEGADHDDKYRMVEDEFLAVAGDFTRHLHAAEYQRLKGLVKSQNAEAIQNISRPVTGEMSDLVKRRHAALDTAARQRRGISKTLGKRSARDGSPPVRSASSLQGLMDSPRKQAVPLTSIPGMRSSSSFRESSPSRRSRGSISLEARRGGTGITQARNNGAASLRFKQEPPTDSDDDDLDSQPGRPSKLTQSRPPVKTERSLGRQPSATEPLARPNRPSGNPFLEGPNAPRRTLSYETPTSEQAAANDDANDANDDGNDSDFFSRMRARRAEQKRRRGIKTESSNIKTESQAAALNEIPFM